MIHSGGDSQVRPTEAILRAVLICLRSPVRLICYDP
jgi:hypothetical protein